MIPDSLISVLSTTVLQRPDGSVFVTMHGADILPGDVVHFRLTDLERSETFDWRIARQVIADAVSGEVSASTVREALTKLYLERAGVLAHTQTPGSAGTPPTSSGGAAGGSGDGASQPKSGATPGTATGPGQGQAFDPGTGVKPVTRRPDSDGDLESHSTGPGDPDLDF